MESAPNRGESEEIPRIWPASMTELGPSPNWAYGLRSRRLTLHQSFNEAALLDLAQQIGADEAVLVGGAGLRVFVLDLVEDGFYFFTRRCRHQTEIALGE